MEIEPNITDFSHELLCHILQYLPLREILSVAMLCKKMLAAVDMHLQLCKSIDFCQDSIFGYMPSTITDDHLLTLLKKCPHLEIVYGLHPVKIERRRLRKRAALTIPGIIEALSLCFHLKAIETSDLRLFEAIMQHLPQLEIIGHFQNRNGLFPPQASQRLKLQPYPRISSLHLIGVEVPELTAMPHLQHLHLQCVRFTKLQPFRAFLAQNLKSFVMKHCIGPSVPQRYLSLIIALSSSPNLSHLELVRVPLLNGLFQRAVEDSYRHNGFVNLRTLVISGCKGILEADLGHLMIVASKNLETLYIQPSLTKDSLFVSLSFAQCSFPVLRNLHLGYIDNLNSSGEWSNDALLSFGLAEMPDTPSSLTDSGMKVISRLFPHIKTLSVSNCPHLMVMYQWMAEEDLEAWSRLTDLTLQKCHCLQLTSFILFISFLPNIQVVILNDMFREPPKGCSHVGLSAGTGLGMSSAVVSNQDEHIAVQGHHQEFEPPGDEENEEIDRDFIDAENEDNPEPQFMVLQRDFFDGEDDDEAVGNPPLENDHDPAVEEDLHICVHEVNNNSLPDENIVIPNDNNISEDSLNSPPSFNNTYVSSISFACENQNNNIKESKYCLRNGDKKIKSSKSDCTEKKIKSQDRSYSTNLKDEKDIKNEVIDSNCCYNSENTNKVSSVRDSLHDYDPHKPSTSKAGNYLDYSDWNGDGQCSKNIEYSNGQNLSKKQKKSPKITKDFTASDKSKKDCGISSQCHAFHNNLNNSCHFRDNYLNCIKEELPQNTLCDTQRNSRETSVSVVTDKIPTNMSCYVLVEKMKIETYSKVSASHAENEDKTTKIDKDNLSKNASCHLNNSRTIKKKKSCTHSISSEKISNNNYSEKSHPCVEDECSYLNTNSKFKDDCEAKTTSEEYRPEINEARSNENLSSLSNSDPVHSTSANDPETPNFDSIEQLFEKKFGINNVYELSEHEMILESSFNESAEETVNKAGANAISAYEKTNVSVDDAVHSFTHENLSPTIIQLDSVATQKSLNDRNDNNSDIENNSLNENEMLGNIPVSKSFEESNSDSHKSYKNVFEKRHSFKEITSEKLKNNYYSVSSKIIKPCCVLVTKIENVHDYFAKNSNEEHKKVNERPCEQAACGYLPALNQDVNSNREGTLSENLGTYDPLQPSTSKTEVNICSDSKRHSRTFKKMCSSKYLKRRSSPVNTRSKKVNLNSAKASSESEINCCSAPKIQNIKNCVENNNHSNVSERSLELSSHNSKELKKSPAVDQIDNSYDEDTKFYVLVPNDGTLEIINSITGNSYQTPHCHVTVTQMGNKICDNFQKTTNYNDKLKINNSQQSFAKQHGINVEFNPDLPSTSKAANHLNNNSENVISSNDKCKMHKKKFNDMKCFECKNFSKCCCNYSVPLSCNTERLRIKNSDARILLKQCNTETNNKCSSYHADTDIVLENEIYRSRREQKIESKSYTVPIPDELRYGCKIENDNMSENNESSSSFEEKTNNPGSNTWRKRKKRKVNIVFKRVKKSLNDSKVNNLSRDAIKNNTKRMSSVPMMSLTSQGTQATSADIRRSIRRIRRASAHRRTVPPVYVSKSRYSSKISAKIMTKRPINETPRPESHDKATSTSDPLLEDDAVQTLQISSSTLLSFTVVSCGISDLIIDQCPKLIHIEVQACRILKRLQFNKCPVIKRLNVSQCPKLNICALASPVMSLSTDSYFLVSYEPCMQGYHPGEGEKAVLSKAKLNQSVLLFHDFCDISYDGIQAKFREKILEWLRFLSQLYLYLNYTRDKKKKLKWDVYEFFEHPWGHDLRRIHGQYSYSSTSADFCDAEGRYQLLTNNPIFCDIFETNQLDSGFPDVADCSAFKDPSLISYEVIEKYLEMQKKFVAFYIPVTENNQVNF